MSHREFQENWKKFVELVDNLPQVQNEQLNLLTKRYVKQNMALLNDMLASSIENLKHLQQAKTSNDIICTQARFTNELSKKLALSAQRFLNASLGNIADYNEWLKTHCELVTD